MKNRRVWVLTLAFLLSALFPSVSVDAANNGRADADKGYLAEEWRAGLGTGIGALNSIKSADIDNDGEDEIVFGNSQGYIHILDWNSSINGFSEQFHSLDLGGAVGGMEIAQIDDDPQLEIAIGYNWNSGAGKVRILDGLSLRAEDNWSGGLSWSPTPQYTDGYPYGLSMGDLDGDGYPELAMGSDRGYLWVVNISTPERYYPWNDVGNNDPEWLIDLAVVLDIPEGMENIWGLTFGQFDSDDSMEVVVGSKQGWVAMFDGETQEVQWKVDMDGDGEKDSLCYSMIAADLNGNGIDEIVVPQQNTFTIFVDGDLNNTIEKTSIDSGYGLASADIRNNDGKEELIVADANGKIMIMGLAGSTLSTFDQWDSGYSMGAGGAGITISTNGHDGKPWIIHGSDAGVVSAWEWDSDTSTESLVWRSDSANNKGQPLYSLENGETFAVTLGNIDDDDNLEMLVGSGSGKVYAFDGITKEMDWVSPVLEKLPLGLAIADLNNDGKNDIVITTGNPGESRLEGIGAEGYMYIFERSGDTFVQTFRTNEGELDAVLSLDVSELDGSSYPEIVMGTGYWNIVDPFGGSAPEPHGDVEVWGYDGSEYKKEWDYGDLGDLVGSVECGDTNEDGVNEIVSGTSGNSAEGTSNAKVHVWVKSGSGYSQGSTMDTDRYYAYGISIGDVDNDGKAEIIVGTSKKDNDKPKIIFYDGSTKSEEFTKIEEGATSVWGIAHGDFDSDGFPELIYGMSSGELKIYDGESCDNNWNGKGFADCDFEAKTSALSGKVGHYGGIAIGNVDNDEPLEMLIGSTSYMWLFSTQGETDTLDLSIIASDITYSPENPDEDDNIVFNITVQNNGKADAPDWKVVLYKGDPDEGGVKFNEFVSDGDDESETILPGGAFTFTRTWYSQQTDPGNYQIYAKAYDNGQMVTETRLSNNKDFVEVNIEEIPNDKPVATATIDKTVLWINELATVDAGDSYDNETTGGEADRNDSEADLTYKYYYDGNWYGPTQSYTKDVKFTSDGDKEIIVIARDERRKESEEFLINIEVRANTPPVAILKSNVPLDDNGTRKIYDGGLVTFDVSDSNDPDDRYDLEYRFSFGDGVFTDWIKENEGTTRLYYNALFIGPNGAELQLDAGEEVLRDEIGNIRIFGLLNGKLVEIKDSLPTNIGYNYTLPGLEEIKTYSAKVMAREVPDALAEEEGLASPWSDEILITVERPANEKPIAVAKIGVYIAEKEGWSYFDIISNEALLPRTGDEIRFTADESSDPDGDDTALSFSWRLTDYRGDDVNLMNDKQERTFSRIFNEPGTYIGTVTVTDERGGMAEHQVEVIVVKSDAYDSNDDDEGLDSLTLAGGALAGVLGLVGGAMGLNKLRGDGDGAEDLFEDYVPEPLELQCPSCGSMIAITAVQRPIQVGCPSCQSNFVLRE